MEPISVVLATLSYLNLLPELEERYELCTESSKAAIQVWDIPTSNSPPGAAPSPVTGGDLGNLREQHADMIRIYIHEPYGNRDSERQVDDLCKLSGGTVSGSNAGFRALASQWRNANPRKWCRVEGYEFFDLNDSQSSKVRKLLRRLKTEVTTLIRGPSRKWARTERGVVLREGEEGQLRVFISCKTFTSKAVAADFLAHPRRFPFTLTERFAEELLQLDEIYRSIRSKDNWRKIFLLQYHHTCVNLFADFLQKFATDYVEIRKQDFDLRQSKLRQWHLKRMSIDSELYRQLSNTGREMTAILESLLDVVIALGGGQQLGNELSVLRAELRGCCKEVDERLSRLSEDLEHRLRFLDLARNMSQTNNVQLLTVLATIFLPMSLAAGILSMQSRFKDLGSVLYDFFGVVVLLGCGAILLLTFMLLLASLKELESRLLRYKSYRQYIRYCLVAAIAGIISIYGALVLSSFLAGMFKDVILGASILGYGTLVAIFGPGILTVLIFALIWIWKLVVSMFTAVRDKAVSWRDNKQKQKDPEDGPVQGILPTRPQPAPSLGNGSGKDDPEIGVREEKDIPRDDTQHGDASGDEIQPDDPQETKPQVDRTGTSHAAFEDKATNIETSSVS